MSHKEHLEKKDGLPLLVDAQLLGKPLAVVDGTVDLGSQGLKGVLGGVSDIYVLRYIPVSS